MQRGAYVEAEKLLREVLADRKEICSPDDDHVVQSIFTLAECLRLECKYDDSVALLEQGLDILNVKHGPSHPGMAFDTVCVDLYVLLCLNTQILSSILQW